MADEDRSNSARKRRPRYRGTHPRRFDEKYKELNPDRFPQMQPHVRAQGRTPAGTHVPVLLTEIIECLKPQPGNVIADCTLGYGGHALELARRIRPGGMLIGLDVDGEQLRHTQQRIEASLQADATQAGAVRCHFSHSNFAGLPQALAKACVRGADAVLADLGVSSMQIDNPSRGFSYKHHGLLDMRMDERTARTAADWLRILSVEELARIFRDYADEPAADEIAAAIAQQRAVRPLTTTLELVDLVLACTRGGRGAQSTDAPRGKERAGDNPHRRTLHPAARVFQALRIKVNDELGALAQFLRVLPACLVPGGRAAIITFHSGEDRLVKRAFEGGMEQGAYTQISDAPITPTRAELRDNPRAASARLRWVRR